MHHTSHPLCFLPLLLNQQRLLIKLVTKHNCQHKSFINLLNSLFEFLRNFECFNADEQNRTQQTLAQQFD